MASRVEQIRSPGIRILKFRNETVFDNIEEVVRRIDETCLAMSASSLPLCTPNPNRDRIGCAGSFFCNETLEGKQPANPIRRSLNNGAVRIFLFIFQICLRFEVDRFNTNAAMEMSADP